MNAIPGIPVRSHDVAQTARRVSRYRSKFDTPRRMAPDQAFQKTTMLAPPRFLPVGDTGISVQFGTDIDPELNEAVAALDQAITAADIAGILDTVPSFRSLLVVF